MSTATLFAVAFSWWMWLGIVFVAACLVHFFMSIASEAKDGPAPTAHYCGGCGEPTIKPGICDRCRKKQAKESEKLALAARAAESGFATRK